MTQLVLSLFPGIGLLDMAFELEGFCVVRGPDLLWGGDIKRFHPPAGKFDGVIGGPPCQEWSPLRYLVRHHHGFTSKFGNLIPEFERIVCEAGADWFVMENVPEAPEPAIGGYEVHSQMLDNRWLGEKQQRSRRFCYGTHESIRFEFSRNWEKYPRIPARRLAIETVALEAADRTGTVTSSDGGARTVQMGRYSLEEACVLQGLPADYMGEAPFRKDAALKAVANGVPLPMGRAVAKAVKRALGLELEATA